MYMCMYTYQVDTHTHTHVYTYQRRLRHREDEGGGAAVARHAVGETVVVEQPELAAGHVGDAAQLDVRAVQRAVPRL